MIKKEEEETKKHAVYRIAGLLMSFGSVLLRGDYTAANRDALSLFLFLSLSRSCSPTSFSSRGVEKVIRRTYPYKDVLRFKKKRKKRKVCCTFTWYLLQLFMVALTFTVLPLHIRNLTYLKMDYTDVKKKSNGIWDFCVTIKKKNLHVQTSLAMLTLSTRRTRRTVCSSAAGWCFCLFVFFSPLAVFIEWVSSSSEVNTPVTCRRTKRVAVTMNGACGACFVSFRACFWRKAPQIGCGYIRAKV